MRDLGRMLIGFGLAIVTIGVVLTFADAIPWLGRLPGDIYIRRENLKVYIPLTTSLVVSVLLTLLFYLFRR